MTEDAAPLWAPTDESLAATRLHQFQAWLEAQRGLHFADYEALWEWSVTDLEGFWSAIWQFFGLDETARYDAVLASHEMPGAEWFPGARLNFADHLLSAGSPEDAAIVAVSESSEPVTLTRADLRRQVGGLAATLSELGVRPGDRVVGYLTNIPPTIKDPMPGCRA